MPAPPLITAIVLALAVAPAPDASARTPPRNDLAPPNVILILTDDQGWADIGYNNDRVYSPHLDALARSGVRLATHYVMPQCTPTRVALLTGRYPGRFRPRALQANNEPVIPLGTPTIASAARAAGYRTYLAGKWHVGSYASHGPNNFGFDSSYGSFAGAVGNYDHRYRPGKFEHSWHRDHAIIEGAENGTHTTDLVAAEAVRVIGLDSPKPFLLYLPFHAVHTPLDERGAFVGRPTQLDPDNPGRWLDEDAIEWFHDPEGTIQSEPDPEKRLLLAAVHHLDAAIGRIVAALERTGKRENTLILFSSDNGPQGSWGGNAYPDDLKLTDFNQPLPMRGKKTDVWQGGIHVPGFACWPGRIEPGEVDTPVHIVDWFPTLVSMLGWAKGDGARVGTRRDGDGGGYGEGTADVTFDGADISPLLLGTGPIEPRDLYWSWSSRTNRWAVRFGRWKIVAYRRPAPEAAGDWQLFDLDADPRESNDVAAEYPAVLAEMHKRFLRHRTKDADG